MSPFRLPPRSRCVAAGAAALLALTACTATSAGGSGTSGAAGDSVGSSASADAQSGSSGGKPITIGVPGGQSGFMSFFDGPALNGMKLAVQDINAKGGVNGRQLRIVTADHKSDVNRIVPAALSVIEQGADVVFASCDYDYGGPAAREANKKGLLALGCAGSPLFGNQGVGPLTFNAYSGTPSEAAAMAQFVKSKGWSHPYLLKDASIDYSKTVCQYFEQSWKSMGGSISGQDTFQNSDTSIASQVTRLKGSAADVVIMCSYPPGGAAAVKQVRDGGVETPIVAAGAFDGSYWLGSVPNLSDFYHPAFGSLSGDDPSADRTALFKAYATLTGKQPPTSTYVLMGYSMVQTLVAALEQDGGSTKGSDLAAAIAKFHDQPLIVGPTTYSDTCHIPVNRPWLMIAVDHGNAKYVGEATPTNVAQAPC